MKKRILVLFLCTLLLLAVGCTPQQANVSSGQTSNVPVASSKPELERIDFQLNWTIVADHSPYYVAIDKGWYTEAGLDVNIFLGQGSGYSVQVIDAGKADIAIADCPVTISTRQKGAKLKIVGEIFDKHPNCSYFLKDSGITSPKDFAGHTIAIPASDASKVMWPAYAKLVGIDPNSVTFINIDTSAKTSAILSKSADITFDLYTAHADKLAAIPEDKLGWFLWSDSGYSAYSISYIVNDSMIKARPEVIKKFLDVTYKAWEYVANNPAEAIDILAKYHPINKENFLKNLNIELNQFIKTERYKKNGIGYIDPAQIKSSYDLVNEYQAKLSFPVEECYDSSFLPSKPYNNFVLK